MSTHKYKPEGTIAVRKHDGDITITTHECPPPKGFGKHYHRWKKNGWGNHGRFSNNNKGKTRPVDQNGFYLSAGV